MNIVKIASLVLIVLAFGACSTEAVDNQIYKKSITKANAQKMQPDKQSQKTDVENSLGVVSLNEKGYGKDKFIHIYNQDGGIWYRFTYYYDGSDGKFEYANENFNPFAFHPDYFVLALKCVGEDENRYEVIVNEETGLKKFVRKDDATLKFETWEKHILKTFAVDFDREQNPLRETPEGQVKDFVLPKEATFHPVEVNGEWLKIRWDSSKKAVKNDKFGWVKWKENNKILIELFYFS
jgi:hypothetical protein